MRMVIGSVLAALALYIVACVGLYFAQRSLIYFPQPRRFTAPGSLIQLPVGGAVLDVTVRPETGPRALIYLGGNAEDVSASLPSLADTFPGQALYLLHYRGYGGSTGTPTEAALFADGLALFDMVKASHPQVTVIGRSLGSGVAVHIASARPVARLVLVTPYDSIVGIAALQFPWFPVTRLLKDKFESGLYAASVNAPTTIIAAANDEIIPRASSQLLLTRFKPGVARYIDVPHTGHNTIADSQLYNPSLAGEAPAAQPAARTN
ncbi:alpha/beta hydrolase [Massilia scottii]|uniref:alpha/beta hydrolase n=1 Tax=Massilia scottii TaxID=3057166 RepID=UPI0027964151|nr:alpha/beta fold hydrolase [Massilia sp. CCM 9029]MDQ1830877.1 alpha/beta hydrolase [Massilia sp. CCM 9029]